MLSIFSCVYWPLVHFLWRAVLLDLLLIVIGQCCPVSICLNRVQLFVTPWTVAHQAPLSMGFCRQEYWGGFPCPPPGDLPNLGIEPQSPAWQADSLPHRRQPTRLPHPWDSPGKNTGVGCYALLQGIFLTQGSNPCLLCLTCVGRQVLYH